MRKYSVLAFVLVLCLMLTGCTRWWRFLPSNGDASDSSDTSEIEYVDSPIIFSVGEVNGETGSTVLLPIYVNESNPIVNADFVLTYDSEKLRPVATVDTSTGLKSYTEDGDFDGVVHSDVPAPGTMNIMMATGGSGAHNCTLFYVAFQVLEPLKSTAQVNIDVSVCGIANKNGGEDIDAMPLNLVSSTGGTVYLIMHG